MAVGIHNHVTLFCHVSSFSVSSCARFVEQYRPQGSSSFFFSLCLWPACCPDRVGLTTKYSMGPNMYFVYYRQDCIFPAHGRVTFAPLIPKTTLVSMSEIRTHSIKCTPLLITSVIEYEEKYVRFSYGNEGVFVVMRWLSYDFSCWAQFSLCFCLEGFKSLFSVRIYTFSTVMSINIPSNLISREK